MWNIFTYIVTDRPKLCIIWFYCFYWLMHISYSEYVLYHHYFKQRNRVYAQTSSLSFIVNEIRCCLYRIIYVFRYKLSMQSICNCHCFLCLFIFLYIKNTLNLTFILYQNLRCLNRVLSTTLDNDRISSYPFIWQ